MKHFKKNVLFVLISIITLSLSASMPKALSKKSVPSTITAVIIDTKGAPINKSGIQVSVSCNGTIYSAYTNSSGIASVSVIVAYPLHATAFSTGHHYSVESISESELEDQVQIVQVD